MDSRSVGMAGHAELRFYARLNEFLPAGRRHRTFTAAFGVGGTVKDFIESQGVPHTEIDAVLVNGSFVGFGYRPRDGDRISVYPQFFQLELDPHVRLGPEPPDTPRFVLDVHLGQLARNLRLLGLDTRYRNDFTDDELVDVSLAEGRILLTRDRGILKRSAVLHAAHVHHTDPRQQTVEVLRRFDLYDAIAPFRRCLVCNGLLIPVDKAEVADRLEPGTLRHHDEFRLCSECDQVYWKGSHHDQLVRFVEDVVRERGPRPGYGQEHRPSGRRGHASRTPT